MRLPDLRLPPALPLRRSVAASPAAPRRRAAAVLALAALGALAGGCTTSPELLGASHAGHNEVVRRRIDEELLLNLVRLRYRDSPLFLQIGGIVSHFELEASAGARATLQDGPNAFGLDVGATASEQPTYTFTPLLDDEFVQRLLRPIDLEVVALLENSGWSIDRVLRLTVQGLGHLENAPRASGPTPASPPRWREFRAVTELLRELQIEGGVTLGSEPSESTLSSPLPAEAVRGADVVAAAQAGYRFETDDGEHWVLRSEGSVPTLHLAPALREDARRAALAEALGLDPAVDRFVLVPSALTRAEPDGGSRSTIAVAARSLLGTLFYLSQVVEVPPEHAERGLVTRTRTPDGAAFDWSEVAGDLLRVRWSAERPADAAVAVPYRGAWFWIADDDPSSKATFALLSQLFALQSSATTSLAPTLTLPVGG